MNLKNLLAAIGGEIRDRNEVTGVSVDSRKIKPGMVFVAYEGVEVDGHNYIDQAIENGAVAVVGEKELKLNVVYVQVSDGRMAWAQLIAKMCGNPEKRLKIIGVTGTDGKTTTTNLIYSILKTAGKKVGMVSTIVAKIGEKEVDTGLHTTSPDPDVLWEFLKQMVDEGCEYAVLEVTSHGLEQERFGKIVFEVGVLTNLAHDHLELHKSVEEYARAKAKLFARSKVSVLSRGTKFLEVFKKKAKGKLVIYDRTKEVVEEEYLIENGQIRQKFAIMIAGKNMEITTTLLGEYNQENILAAIKVGEGLGLNASVITRGIESLEGLPGRMQFIANDRGINAVVDFAHTENAMRQVLSVVRKKLMKKKEKLIVVFGCNGQRDRSKRAPMGKTACEFADLVVVTTEDPRKESVEQIFEDIRVGCEEGGGVINRNYFRVDDRKAAIKKAVEMAKKSDWVMCLGKGHEQSMNMGGVEKAWNEVEVVKVVIADFGPEIY